MVGTIAALALAVGIVPTASAEAVTEQSQAGGEDSAALFKQYDEQLFSRHFKEALAIADKLDVNSSDPELRADNWINASSAAARLEARSRSGNAHCRDQKNVTARFLRDERPLPRRTACRAL